MAASRRKNTLAAVLLWIGRGIAGAWGIIFLLSITAELVSGYPPGGSLFTSILNFTSGILILAGVALSFSHVRSSGLVLVIVWLVSSLILLLGLEPQSNIVTGLVVGTIVELLPGLLIVMTSILSEGQRAHTATEPLSHYRNRKNENR